MDGCLAHHVYFVFAIPHVHFFLCNPHKRIKVNLMQLLDCVRRLEPQKKYVLDACLKIGSHDTLSFFKPNSPGWVVTPFYINRFIIGWIKEVPPNSYQIHTLNAQKGSTEKSKRQHRPRHLGVPKVEELDGNQGAFVGISCRKKVHYAFFFVVYFLWFLV